MKLAELRQSIFSPDGLFRYTLWRQWDDENPEFVQFIGLNPSTATETDNDPTIRRCIGFAKLWGYGALSMTNLFAFRTTDPARLLKCSEPIGTKNDEYLLAAAKHAKTIVAAWGTRGGLLNRDEKVVRLIGKLQCIGVTKHGHPKHPLYLPKTATLQPFPERQQLPRQRPFQ
jgi:hypothetical protein